MPTVTLTFTQPLNESVQIGDTVYYSVTSSVGGFTEGDAPVEIGPVSGITGTENTPVITVANPTIATAVPTSPSPFIMFSKDNSVNMSSLLGYYAKFRIENDSPSESEIFAVNADIFGSS